MSTYLTKEELEYLIWIATNAICVNYKTTSKAPVFQSEYIRLDTLDKLVKLNFVKIVVPETPEYPDQVELRVTVDGRWKISTTVIRDLRIKNIVDLTQIKNII